jgi:thymidylate synthase ThyX
MLTMEWQRLSPANGYITPVSLADISAVSVWDEAMEKTAALSERLGTALGRDVAQYAMPFAYRVRYYMHLNAREAFHLLELRSQQGGHPDYRRVAQEMHRLIRDQAGHRQLADAMRYVDHADYELARLETERRAAAKRAALGITEPE